MRDAVDPQDAQNSLSITNITDSWSLDLADFELLLCPVLVATATRLDSRVIRDMEYIRSHGRVNDNLVAGKGSCLHTNYIQILNASLSSPPTIRDEIGFRITCAPASTLYPHDSDALHHHPSSLPSRRYLRWQSGSSHLGLGYKLATSDYRQLVPSCSSIAVCICDILATN
ncbi:hypothetical protein Pst134EA_009015 [Puccinia striiformis f. sp. tritici]|uniref:hypothetical protein n=1 Tax=Puccinia striiformis f. sp. tritici TaxID=168172 RepID=UPI0020072AB1|nr:hypothetical protein Pst134EA_009015 [Puccinia striiformis f. sp. tritici]KAH9457720.1 hypothetical protein Pst134EB_010037 [Puccinia striiformis f. sp. tritici]KAH9468472.1 hypothetical protein Pst134EA_009015 [Puccinia striiformis f. sp. tritici]